MTGRELLQLQAVLHGLPIAPSRAKRVTSCSSALVLTAAGDRRVGTYSGGMRRRLDLALALDPRARGPVPRRADHRPRSQQPRRSVGRGSDAQRERARRSSSRPSTWRRPTASRAGSRSSTTGGSSPRARREAEGEVGDPTLQRRPGARAPMRSRPRSVC